MSVQCSRQAAVGWKISSKFEADPQLNLIAAGTAQYEACCSLGHDHLKGLRLLEKRSEKYLGISRRGCFRVATWLVSNGSERKGFQSNCPLTREAISSFHLAGTSRRLEISGDLRSIKTGDIWEALHRHWLRSAGLVKERQALDPNSSPCGMPWPHRPHRPCGDVAKWWVMAMNKSFWSAVMHKWASQWGQQVLEPHCDSLARFQFLESCLLLRFFSVAGFNSGGICLLDAF